MILSPNFRERPHILEKYLFIVKKNLIILNEVYGSVYVPLHVLIIFYLST